MPDLFVDQHHVDDLFKQMQSALAEEPFVILVDNQFLIDRIRLVEGELEGRKTTSIQPSFDGVDVYDWIPLAHHTLMAIKSVAVIARSDQDWSVKVNPAAFSYVCNWCGRTETFADSTEAQQSGWSTIKDILDNDMDFCPDEDCQDACAQYRQGFAKIKRS